MDHNLRKKNCKVSGHLLGNGVEGFAGSDDVVALVVGGVVDGLELFGDFLHFRLRVRLADELAEVEILHRVARRAHLSIHTVISNFKNMCLKFNFGLTKNFKFRDTCVTHYRPL